MHFFIDNRPVYRDRETQKSFDNSLYFYSKFISNCPICLFYQEDPCIIPCGHSFCKNCLLRLTEFSSRCPVCDAFFWASRPVRFFFFEQITASITFRRLESAELDGTDERGFFEYPYCYCYYDSGGGTAEGAPGAISGEPSKAGGADVPPAKGPEDALQRLAISPGAGAQDRPQAVPRIALCSVQGIACSKSPRPAASGTHGLAGKTPPSFVFYQSADGQLYFLHPRTYKNYKTFPEFIFGRIKEVHSCHGGEHRHPELQHVPHNYTINIVTIF